MVRRLVASGSNENWAEARYGSVLRSHEGSRAEEPREQPEPPERVSSVVRITRVEHSYEWQFPVCLPGRLTRADPCVTSV